MEANKIVLREAFATVPPTAEYSITDKGNKLEGILTELYRWGVEYV